MLEFVILIGIISALIFTLISVGMAETENTTGGTGSYKLLDELKEYGTAANNWYGEFGFKYKLTASSPNHEVEIGYDTSDGGNHYSLLNIVTEILPPLMYGVGDDKNKTPEYLPGETGPEGPPGSPGADAIDGTDGVNGINGIDGTNGEGGGGSDDVMSKYRGATFIIAPNNNGNIATQGYASATGNQGNDGSDVYAHGTGHVFKGGMPDSLAGASGNYSITAENLAGHVTNNIQGTEPQVTTSDSQLTYGHNQEVQIPFKKENLERN